MRIVEHRKDNADKESGGYDDDDTACVVVTALFIPLAAHSWLLRLRLEGVKKPPPGLDVLFLVNCMN